MSPLNINKWENDRVCYHVLIVKVNKNLITDLGYTTLLEKYQTFFLQKPGGFQ
jgi:hypothetical protein